MSSPLQNDSDRHTPWAESVETLLDRLGVQPEQGLAVDEARRRLARFGPNLLRAQKSRPWLLILAAQFRGMVVALLAAAALLAFFFGDWPEGFAIVAVLGINAAIGFVTELRATRSMEALRGLARIDTTVRRDGMPQRLPAEALVPGDIVLVEAGDIITADLRLLETAKLAADESALTGESAAVSKTKDAIADDAPLMERRNMLFKGSTAVRGSGLAVVTATGLATELGHISELVTSARTEATPLEERLDALGRRLVWVTLALSAAIAVAGVLGGRELRLAVEVAIALAVAAIPEGLPIVATIALARGMQRMARRQALVRRLAAVETLGATGVILTDKTGTLTENRMTVTRVELADRSFEVSGTGLDLAGEFLIDGGEPEETTRQRLDEALETAVLCSNAALEIGRDDDPEATSAVGDPTEVALLIAAAKRGIRRETLAERLPELREEPFDPETKAMATFNRDGETLRVCVKGAPEVVLGWCTSLRGEAGDETLSEEARRSLADRAASLAGKGLRTLALATRQASSLEEEPYGQLVFQAIVGLLDPAREGVRDALEECRSAGVRVVMVTGDHLATATRVAERTGLLADEEDRRAAVFDASAWPGDRVELDDEALSRARVFARATPHQKLELIRRYQGLDQVVAMTGDGVNDAPALKQADIGVAMGIRGTEVAKEAAAMVLQDDEFRTIVAAIEQGRAIYANLRKFVLYLLSCNISEILVIGLATLAGAPLPLLPLQILFLNLVTDVFPALALGVGRGSDRLMQDPPRRASERILEPRHWLQIVLQALTIALAVLGAMALAMTWLAFEASKAVTVSFLTLALAQLWHVFNMRAPGASLVLNEVTRNRWVWAAIALCLVLLAAALLVPPLREVLRLVDPGIEGLALALAASLLPLLLGPPARWLAHRLVRR